MKFFNRHRPASPPPGVDPHKEEVTNMTADLVARLRALGLEVEHIERTLNVPMTSGPETHPKS